MSKKISAGDYFRMLEPDPMNRGILFRNLMKAMSPRNVTAEQSVVLIEGLPSSGKSTLIRLMLLMVPSCGLLYDNKMNMRKPFTNESVIPKNAQVVYISFQQDESPVDIVGGRCLPMLSNDVVTWRYDNNAYVTAPKFRYLMEHDQTQKNETGYIAQTVLRITLTQTFQGGSKNVIEVDPAEARAYIIDFCS